MITLPYGLQKPENLDRGDVFFDALSNNIVKNDSHNHNGVNSPLLNTDSLNRAQITLASGSWISDAGKGQVRQQITLPGQYVYGKAHIEAIYSSGPYDTQQVALEYRKVNPTTVWVVKNPGAYSVVLTFT